jgi:hypothetical protein
LKWGQRKIVFNNDVFIDGRRLNLDESVNDEELANMLDNQLEVSFDSKRFEKLPDDMNITFNVSRANNSRLAHIDSELMNNSIRDNGLANNVIAIESHYHGKLILSKKNQNHLP